MLQVQNGLQNISSPVLFFQSGGVAKKYLIYFLLTI